MRSLMTLCVLNSFYWMDWTELSPILPLPSQSVERHGFIGVSAWSLSDIIAQEDDKASVLAGIGNGWGSCLLIEQMTRHHVSLQMVVCERPHPHTYRTLPLSPTRLSLYHLCLPYIIRYSYLNTIDKQFPFSYILIYQHNILGGCSFS